MIEIFGNNCTTTLATSLSSVATTLTVFPGAGTSFPQPAAGQYFVMTLNPSAGGNSNEIVWVTSVSGDTFTITRAQENTTATSWASGDFVSCYPTAGTQALFLQPDQAQKNLYGYGVAGGTANALTVTIPSNLTATPDGMQIVVKASGANTQSVTINVTLGTTIQGAVNIIKGNNQLLVPGDIPAAGYPICISWDATLSVWVMQNPVKPSRTGLVGDARNFTLSITTASNSFTAIATQLVLYNATQEQSVVLNNFNQTINTLIVGAGGMDVGSPPASSFLGIYAIYNPATASRALLATLSNIALNEVYSGANLPAGYSYSCLVAIVPTRSDGKFIACYQEGRAIWFPPVQILSTGTTQAAYTAVSVSTIVPMNAKYVAGKGNIASSLSGTNQLLLAASAAGIGEFPIASASTTGNNNGFSNLPIITPQLIYYIATITAGVMTLVISITGYTI